MTVRRRQTTHRGYLGGVVAMSVLVLALPACRVTVRTDVDATWSGSGTLAVRISLDEPARAALAELGIGEDIFSGAAATTTSAPTSSAQPEAAAQPFSDLTAAGWDVSTEPGTLVLEHPFGDPAELRALTAQVSGDVDPPLFPRMELSVDSGLFTSQVELDAAVNPTAEMIVALAGRGLGTPPTAVELEHALGVPVAEAFTFVFAISLPGRETVVTDPADAASAGPSAWEVPVGTTLEVRARTSARTPAFWVALVSIGIAVLMASAVVVLEVVWQRRQTSRPRMRGTGTAPRHGDRRQATGTVTSRRGR